MNVLDKMKNLELEGDTCYDNNTDSDACDLEEIKSTFNGDCKLLASTKLGIGNKYILHIDGTLQSNPTLALGNSDGSIEIFNLDQGLLGKQDTLLSEDARCIGLKFNKNDNNLLYAGYTNGVIKLWDLRESKKSVTEFKDTTLENPQSYKPLTCIDVSPNNRLLTAGTELCKGDAYILFWDVRNVKLLGGYWESHTDDITELSFHPDDLNKLISSSTDGLINIYDLAEFNEEDALLNSFNTSSSVERIGWFQRNNSDAIYCSTHTYDVQLWGLEDAEPYVEFNRSTLGEKIKKKSADYIYTAGSHETNNNLLLLVGSNCKEGECLRGLSVDEETLVPAFNFDENKQRVRGNWYNKMINVLVTGGEKGILDVWRLKELDSPTKKKKKAKI